MTTFAPVGQCGHGEINNIVWEDLALMFGMLHKINTKSLEDNKTFKFCTIFNNLGPTF